jgi:hypothetical protein
MQKSRFVSETQHLGCGFIHFTSEMTLAAIRCGVENQNWRWNGRFQKNRFNSGSRGNRYFANNWRALGFSDKGAIQADAASKAE